MPNEHFKALVKAQKEMGKLLRNSTNPHFKSKYADLQAVIDACGDALADNGFAILQPSGKDELGMFTDTVLAHENGETFSTRVYWVGQIGTMQQAGSALTYARRYGLMSLTGLAPEDDDGAEASKAPAKPRTQEPKPVERDPVAIRNSLKGLIADAKDADTYAKLTKGERFTGALAWLAENDEPKHKEVVAAMDEAEKRLLAAKLDDGIPDFDKETGEVR